MWLWELWVLLKEFRFEWFVGEDYFVSVVFSGFVIDWNSFLFFCINLKN